VVGMTMWLGKVRLGWTMAGEARMWHRHEVR
jgi:hypothetical protein